MDHIVKRKGHTERFDERKVYASCYAACLCTHMPKAKAEKICEKISREMKAWIKKREMTTSTQIFHEMVKLLRKHDADVAFMFETHRDVS